MALQYHTQTGGRASPIIRDDRLLVSRSLWRVDELRLFSNVNDTTRAAAAVRVALVLLGRGIVAEVGLDVATQVEQVLHGKVLAERESFDESRVELNADWL